MPHRSGKESTMRGRVSGPANRSYMKAQEIGPTLGTSAQSLLALLIPFSIIYDVYYSMFRAVAPKYNNIDGGLS